MPSETSVHSLADWNDPSYVLRSFDDLLMAFRFSELFSACKVNSFEQALFLEVQCERTALTFVSQKGLIKQKDPDLDRTILCISYEESLKQTHNDMQQLVFPFHIAHLASITKNLFKLQKSSNEIKYVLSISRELNGERDIPKLLNLILKKAREVTCADAGSIYTIEKNKNTLKFRFTQNDSIQQDLSEFEIPINERSIVGNVVINAKEINIPDLYLLSENPSENIFGLRHDRSWDKKIGYESHSMLTVPMFDITHSVIGVIQLINCKKDPKKILKDSDDFKNQIIAFDPKSEEYAQIVAQQAGVALENANMQDEIEKLFHSFVNASVSAIELRDPTTSGHSNRVAKITLSLAKMVNQTSNGIYKNLEFNDDQMREIEYASLLHDFGKVGVKEHILVKSKKLFPVQFDLINERFAHIRSCIEMSYLKSVIDLMENPQKFAFGLSQEDLQLERSRKLTLVQEYYEFICKANEPTVLVQGDFDLLKDIANAEFSDFDGKLRSYILPEEIKALSISKGSLTTEEFAEIQSHVVHTYDFLRKIPWGQKLANVPQIAAKHHEKLDGTGYPTGALGPDIPVQSRMMAIADIFDALTANDRPYKKAVPLTRALEIIEMDVKGGKIDTELFKIFIESKAYEVVIATVTI